jgi:uncharacterized protein (TIGR02996 family)
LISDASAPGRKEINKAAILAALQDTSTMTDLDRLLAAAIEQPADPAPRLVLADWLEEHGDATGRVRADLVRWQVRREATAQGEQKELDRQAREALRQHPQLKGFLRPILARHRAEPLSLGPALVTALCAPLASAGEEPFPAGSTWRGLLHLDSARYPTTLTIRQRDGTAFSGDMTQDFSSLLATYSDLFAALLDAGATFYFRGAVVGERMTFATHRVTGMGAWPGLYELRLSPGGRVRGPWWLPVDGRRGELVLRRSHE